MVVLDDFSTGRRENLLEVEDDVTIIEGSVTDLETCRRAAEGADFVLHQAALPSVPRSVKDPIAAHAVNATGTLNVLVASRDAGVRRVVYAGSSSAYGNTPQLPKVETIPPAPLSPYAVSKVIGEMYCRIFNDLYGLETVVLRYFNVFGPRQDPNSEYAAVIPKFITALLEGRRPTIFGDGEQTRDFTYVENVVEANLRACEKFGVAGHVINCACGERTSITALFEAIAKIIGTSASPIYGASREGEVEHSFADITKAGRLLGYAPTISLSEGLGRTAALYVADATRWGHAD